MGGTSVLTLLSQPASCTRHHRIRKKSVGAEAPPTRTMVFVGGA
ncbi:DUF6053 domain-containing protein [Lysobacter enzymogenes]